MQTTKTTTTRIARIAWTFKLCIWVKPAQSILSRITRIWKVATSSYTLPIILQSTTTSSTSLCVHFTHKHSRSTQSIKPSIISKAKKRIRVALPGACLFTTQWTVTAQKLSPKNTRIQKTDSTHLCGGNKHPCRIGSGEGPPNAQSRSWGETNETAFSGCSRHATKSYFKGHSTRLNKVSRSRKR